MKVPIQFALVSLAVAAIGVVAPVGQKSEAGKQGSKDKALAMRAAPKNDKTQRPIDFSRDVKPILSEHCFKCHGPDAAVVAAGVRLDTYQQAIKHAITPGKPEESFLWIRVSNPDPNLRMPPKDSGVPPLTDAQKDILRRWIASGAKYETHWSFIPPKMPVLPHVSNFAWVKNPIDRFVLNQLDKAGLKPEPEADRATLAMRASITLTGLPPRPDLAEAFERDTRPDAYERYVDSLLASPAYGEHQARYWLDAVRYGDTHGLHLDNERLIYPYRDWVVRSLNSDLPFDQFAVWQLAGDLLPNPTVDQLIATGYIRMNPTTNEGGAIEAEFQAKNTFDRVDTTSTVFMGLTVACSRCHDHKYDPIKQKEYYGLFAFFNSTADKPLDDNAQLPAPAMRAPDPEQAMQLKAYQHSLEESQSRASEAEAMAWLKGARKPMPVPTKWELSPPYSGASFDDAYDKAFDPETEKASSVAWKPFQYKMGDAAANVIAKENSSAYVRTVVRMDAAGAVPLTASSDDAIKIWVNGKLVHANKVLRGINQSYEQVTLNLNAGENTLMFKVTNGGGPDGFMARFGDALTDRINAMYALWNGGDPSQRKLAELQDLYLEAGPDSPASQQYRQTKKSRDEFEASLPMTLIAQELPTPREAFVLRRGEYSMPTDKVTRGLPASLGKLDPSLPLNRLGLAKWIVNRNNPLTARVFVNRVWQNHFGTGIVKTSEDFGSQGEFPMNKALLDYLAVTFMDQGWSMKKLHRMIVTSAAFRQRSSADKVKLAKDAENRLISRGPRFRLDAEVIRDKALAASGLLVTRMGGHGFKPYQPDGIWEAIAFVESNTSRYAKDNTDDIYRRSLYLFWKRTSPHPIMLAYDAPMRESCTVRRFRTNTPLQALVSMNEPAFLECSRVLAQRILEEEVDENAIMDRAFLYSLGRKPSVKERALMVGALNRYRLRYASDTAGALKLLKVGDSNVDKSIKPAELAAWMMVCSTLMNTDEFLTQH